MRSQFGKLLQSTQATGALQVDGCALLLHRASCSGDGTLEIKLNANMATLPAQRHATICCATRHHSQPAPSFTVRPETDAMAAISRQIRHGDFSRISEPVERLL